MNTTTMMRMTQAARAAANEHNNKAGHNAYMHTFKIKLVGTSMSETEKQELRKQKIAILKDILYLANR